MRVLFDENTSFALAQKLIGHDCSSVVYLGWQGTKNGKLLTRAQDDGFDVLITLDDDMQFEQNMQGRKISLVILKPRIQGKIALAELAEKILNVLTTLVDGQIYIIDHRTS